MADKMSAGYDISASASTSSSAPSSTGATGFGSVIITNFGNIAGVVLIVGIVLALILLPGKKK